MMSGDLSSSFNNAPMTLCANTCLRCVVFAITIMRYLCFQWIWVLCTDDQLCVNALMKVLPMYTECQRRRKRATQTLCCVSSHVL